MGVDTGNWKAREKPKPLKLIFHYRCLFVMLHHESDSCLHVLTRLLIGVQGQPMAKNLLMTDN